MQKNVVIVLITSISLFQALKALKIYVLYYIIFLEFKTHAILCIRNAIKFDKFNKFAIINDSTLKSRWNVISHRNN